MDLVFAAKMFVCVVAYPAGLTWFPGPVAAGTVVARCSIPPSRLSGIDAASFSISGNGVKVAVPLAQSRIYRVRVYP